MKTSYFTFGQDHAHRIPNITLDKDIVIKITDDNPRKVMFDYFGAKWSQEYDNVESIHMEYYSRGIYDLKKKEFVKS